MKSMRGLSIVELMVALLLGSLVAVAATQLFLVNQQTNNLQNGLAFVQDQGRFAFSYITRDLMQAGYNSEGDALAPFIFGATTVPGGDLSSNNDVNGSDKLVMQVNGGTDCLGNTFVGVKIYRINGEKGLLCSIRSFDEANDVWAPMTSEVILENVEAFEVLYGIDSDANNGDAGYGSADFYSTADELVATDRIVSVRYALLLASDRIVSSEAAYVPETIQVLDQAYDNSEINYEDGRAYRVYTSTVGIRNQI